MTNYNIDFDTFIRNQLPVDSRKPKMIAWVSAILSAIAWCFANFFVEYTNGSSVPAFNPFGSYVIGDRVRSYDNAIYECQVDGAFDVPQLPGTIQWMKVCDDFRGVNERILYTSKKLQFEYILNRWFHTIWVQPDSDINPQGTRPDIFIDNIALNNNIYIFGATEAESSNTYYLNSENSAPFAYDYAFSSAAFSINVPSSTSITEAQIRAIADRYVCAGILYTVNFY